MKRPALHGIAALLLLASGLRPSAAAAGKYCLRASNGTDFLQVTSSHQPRVAGKACGPWEQFALEGELRVSAKVALKGNFGRYLSAQPNGSLEGNRPAAGAWEQFVITAAGKPAGAPIRPGDKIFLRSFHGKWLQAVGSGGDAAAANGGGPWQWEGFVLTALEPSFVPVYSETPITAPHSKYHYSTRAAAEANKYGWKQLGVAFRVPSTQVPGSVPVYRETLVRAPHSRYYYSTRAAAEANKYGWRQLETGWYAFPSQVPGTIPVYMETPAAAPHSKYYLSTRPEATANEYGFQRLGVAFYAYPPGGSGASAPPAPAPTLAAALKKDPNAASLLKALERPDVKAKLAAAHTRVTAADSRLAVAKRKLAELVRNPAGLFGAWKTKWACDLLPTCSKVRKTRRVDDCKWKRGCKKVVFMRIDFSICGCRTVCVPGTRICKSFCADRYRDCSAKKTESYDATVCSKKCGNRRYFDLSAGKLYQSARKEAEKKLAAAKAAFRTLKSEVIAAYKKIRDTTGGVLRTLTQAIEGYIRKPRSLADVVARVPPFMRNLFPKIFEMAGDAMLRLMQPLLKKWVASRAIPAASIHARLPRRSPAPMCGNLLADPVKQIRTSMAASATGLLLVATGKLKANYLKFGKNATLMSWHWRPGGSGRANLKQMMTKFSGAMSRLRYFFHIPKVGETVRAFGVSSAAPPKPGAVKPPPPAGGWKATFKQAVKKGLLPLALVAIQWAAVAAAGPFSHGQCHALLEGTAKGMASYQKCFRDHYIAWSRTTFFDALVGTAVGALSPLIEKVALGFSGAIAAAVISSFPAAAPWVLPTSAVIGMAMNVAAAIGLTALADKLIPWYLETFWPADPKNPGAGNVKKYFTDRAFEGSATFPKTWYVDKYYVDESKNAGGKSRCNADTHCTGTRLCRSGYCWIDEKKNPKGEHRCTQDIDCASPRVCSSLGYCGAPSGGSAARRGAGTAAPRSQVREATPAARPGPPTATRAPIRWRRLWGQAIHCGHGGCLASGPGCDTRAVPGQCSFPRATAQALCERHPQCSAVTCNEGRRDCQARRANQPSSFRGFTSYVKVSVVP